MAHSLNDRSRKRRRASTTISASPVPSMPLTPDTDRDDAQEINGATAGRSVPQRTKFIVGLDYGTTYSSVSYVKFDVATPPNTIVGNQIESIDCWPGSTDRWRNPEVSSESWYHGRDFHWGYNARQPIKGLEDGGLDGRNRIIQFAKLLLCERHTDDGPQDDLRETMRRLEKTGKDLIKDYIREILKHSKAHLEQKEDFREDCEVELVLCVPAGWPAKALRTMQEILLEVTQEIKFGILAPLFILNEPEAAAAYMLEALPGRRALNEGDVFIVCDAGGGTVDTITYRVRREHPFRLDEVVAPAGKNCGSSYINKALKTEVIRRLEDARSLEGPSFEYIIEYDVMHHIEYNTKKPFDPADGLDGDEGIRIQGLKKNPRKGFGNSTLFMPRKQIREFFDWSLNGVGELIREQMNAVDEKGLTVSNILLAGGFSISPVFVEYIQNTFPGLTLLDTKGDKTIAVSHGAVFRALNKDHGPRRIIQSNFGFLQIEKYNAKRVAHKTATPTRNSTNGKMYVYNVIDWVIKKNRVLKTKEPFRRLNHQTFGMDDELVISQLIYVSDDDRVLDGYQLGHTRNNGAEVFGRLVVDLQKVKDEGLFQTKSGPQGALFYELHYELGMEVDGRNLTVKLFCPPGGQCRGQTQLCIAAAFIPGTA